MNTLDMKWAVVQPLIGGMPLGYQARIGTQPEFIIDNDVPNNKEYINYMNNIMEYDIPVINMSFDLSSFDSPEDEALFNTHNVGINIVCYVPVCSGLCMLSTSKSRGDADNEQNQNMYNLSKFIIDNINPLVAVMENAPTAYSNSGQSVLDRLVQIGSKRDFTATIERVDTYDHGIPQHRQRTFVYFWNSNNAPYLEYEKVETPNLIDYYNLIPENASNQEVYPQGKYNNQDITYECIQDLFNSNGEIKSIVDVFLSVIDEDRNTSGLNLLHRYDDFASAIKWSEEKLAGATSDEDIRKYTRALKKFKHCKNKIDDNKGYWDSSLSIATHRNYINALIGKIIMTLTHPYENRALNLREMTWLMGHPHDFELTTNSNYVMLTQNVPVRTAAHSAHNAVLFVNSSLEMSKSTFVKQNNIKQRVDFE